MWSAITKPTPGSAASSPRAASEYWRKTRCSCAAAPTGARSPPDPWCSPGPGFPSRGKVFCRPGWHNSRMSTLPQSIDDALALLTRADYVAERSLASAVYEWNYSRQMIEIRLAETQGTSRDTVAKDIFSERFLIKRPLMQALEG